MELSGDVAVRGKRRRKVVFRKKPLTLAISLTERPRQCECTPRLAAVKSLQAGTRPPLRRMGR